MKEYRVVGMDGAFNRTSQTYGEYSGLHAQASLQLVKDIVNARGGRIEVREVSPWERLVEEKQ